MNNKKFELKSEIYKAIITTIVAAFISFGFWLIQDKLQSNEKESDYKLRLLEEQASLLQEYRALVIDRLELKVLENERMMDYGTTSEDYYNLQGKLKTLSPVLYEKVQNYEDIENKLLGNFFLMENLFDKKSIESINLFKSKVMQLTFSDHLQIYEEYKKIKDPNYIPLLDKVDYQIEELKVSIISYYNQHLESMLKNLSSNVF